MNFPFNSILGKDYWDKIIKIGTGETETVTNNATLQNHTKLVYPVNGAYHFQLLLLYSASDTTRDFKCNFTFPAGSNSIHRSIGNSIADAIQVNSGIQTLNGSTFAADITFGEVFAGLTMMAQIEIFLVTTGSGNFQFKFANNSAAVAGTSSVLPGTQMLCKQF